MDKNLHRHGTITSIEECQQTDRYCQTKRNIKERESKLKQRDKK